MNYSGRINRIRGQVNGIARMLESDRECMDVVQQIFAVRSAITNLGLEILKDESQNCKDKKDFDKLNSIIEKIVYLN